MFQVPSTHVVERQAALAGVPWVNVNTSGEVPQDIEVLEQALSQLNIDGFVSGALRSDYQKARLERMAERLGVVSWTPLWHQSGHDHVKGMLSRALKS